MLCSSVHLPFPSLPVLLVVCTTWGGGSEQLVISRSSSSSSRIPLIEPLYSHYTTILHETPKTHSILGPLCYMRCCCIVRRLISDLYCVALGRRRVPDQVPALCLALPVQYSILLPRTPKPINAPAPRILNAEALNPRPIHPS